MPRAATVELPLKSEAPSADGADPRPTRDQILDAAERLFAQRGFSGVSMRDIVAETDLRNQASLYHHFRNKKALYEAVLQRGLDGILMLVPGPGTATSVGPNIDRLLDYLSKHPHLAQLIQRASMDDSRYMKKAINSLLRPVYSQGRRALTGADQIWEADEIPHLAAGLYLLIFGYFANADMLKTVVGADPLSEQAVDRQRRFLKVAVSKLLGLGEGDRNQEPGMFNTETRGRHEGQRES
jgi:AcrR family transcriptional regulator